MKTSFQYFLVAVCAVSALPGLLSAAPFSIGVTSFAPMQNASGGALGTGSIVQVGYFEGVSSSTDPASYTASEWASFTPISGIDSANSDLLSAINDFEAKAGAFAVSLHFDTDTHVLPASGSVRLGIRIFDSATITSGSSYNTVAGSRDTWIMVAPGASGAIKATPPTPLILAVADSGLSWQYGGAYAGRTVTDNDGDGIPDSIDTDGDGVGDDDDAFPNDPNETIDTDGDGVGDNGDAFPYDPNETTDTDGDGVGDNGDTFPNDPNETTDTDGDGVGDKEDLFPEDEQRATIIDHIEYIIEYVSDDTIIFDSDWKKKKMRKAYLKKLEVIVELVIVAETAEEEGAFELATSIYKKAAKKLKKNLIKKTDGLQGIGAKAKNDWVKVQEAQDLIYPDLLFLSDYFWLKKL